MKLNKKGFVFVESIIILSIVMIAMLGLYTTSSRFFTRIKQIKRYDDISDVYKVYAIKNIIIKEISSANTKLNGVDACNSGGVQSIKSVIQGNSKIKNVFGNDTNLGFEDAYVVNTSCLDLGSANRTRTNYLKRIDKNDDYVYLVIEYKKDNDYNYVSLKVGTN